MPEKRFCWIKVAFELPCCISRPCAQQGRYGEDYMTRLLHHGGVVFKGGSKDN
jgi:hypothetical protein